MLEHFFYTQADGVAVLGEGGDGGLGLGGDEGLELELLAEGGDFGLGFGAGFALPLYDLYCAKDLLFKGLELVDADGGCAHYLYSCARV